MFNEYKCLVVDDDETWRTKIYSMLKIWGYEVVVAKDANQALDLLRTELIDLVMLEIHMKDTDGIELMQQIHREFNKPVTLMSQVHTTEFMVNALKNGAVSVLLKPTITLDEFKYLWQYVELHRKKIYDQKGKGKLGPDVGVSSHEDVSVSSDDDE